MIQHQPFSSDDDIPSIDSLPNIEEKSEFSSVVKLLTTETPILGYDGIDIGPSNWQAQALANRTVWLRSQHDKVLAYESPIIGANSILLTGFNEFDYDTKTQINKNGNTYNGIYDEYISGKKPESCAANFIHMVDQDLSRIPTIENIMFWVQWFCLTGASGTDPENIYPAINHQIKEDLMSTSQWSAGGYSSSDAITLNGETGGSPHDESLIRGMRYLQTRGYTVGFAPIVLGHAEGESSPLVWRGYFNFTTAEKCQAWFDSHESFVKYYIDLFLTNGIILNRCTVGSEFEGMALSAPAEQWAIFSASMQRLAKYIKNKFPDCTVTYAANYTDAGVGARFRCDSLWTSQYIDEVGIDWYVPLSENVTNDNFVYNKNIRSGEYFDYEYELSDPNQRRLSQSLGRGKTNETKISIKQSSGIKNLSGFYFNNHYIEKPANALAEATPLAGFDRDYNPHSLGYLQGTCVLETSMSAVENLSGMRPAINESVTWLAASGATYGYFSVPETNAVTYELEATYQLTGTPDENYGRILRLENSIEVYIDGTTVKLAVNYADGQFNVNLGSVDTNTHVLKVIVDGTTSTITVTYDGVKSEHSAAGLSSLASGDFYIATYSGTSNFVPVKLFLMGLKYSIDGVEYGGVFHFDEVYAGTRTAWNPRSKPIALAELGFASMSGGSVEPNQFPYSTDSDTAMEFPSIMNDTTKAILNSFVDHGWTPGELWGAYGSSFNIDQVEQYNALKSSMTFFNSLKKDGVISNVTIYSMDARPYLSRAALLNGRIYYSDAAIGLFDHSLNGKIAGGNYDEYLKLMVRKSIFDSK